MSPVLQYARDIFSSDNFRADAAKGGRTSAQSPRSRLSCSTGLKRLIASPIMLPAEHCATVNHVPVVRHRSCYWLSPEFSHLMTRQHDVRADRLGALVCPSFRPAQYTCYSARDLLFAEWARLSCRCDKCSSTTRFLCDAQTKRFATTDTFPRAREHTYTFVRGADGLRGSMVASGACSPAVGLAREKPRLQMSLSHPMRLQSRAVEARPLTREHVHPRAVSRRVCRWAKEAVPTRCQAIRLHRLTRERDRRRAKNSTRLSAIRTSSARLSRRTTPRQP